ncbi:MAG: helix-turn-helix domain-containing protein [Kofleriaceae bacterium]
MPKALLTTNDVAELLGVGTTSVKRWADSGALPCVKTPGGHRRFERVVVEALREHGLPVEDSGPVEAASWVDRWLHVLVHQTGPLDAYRLLVGERQLHDDWWQTCDRVGEVLVALGERWVTGDLTLVEEHIASERLARGLARCAEAFSVMAGAPVALLMTAEGDEHVLGLHMVELGLRELGWTVRWVGRAVPIRHALEYLGHERIDCVIVSASSYSTDATLMADQVERIGTAATAAGAAVIFGGAGAWPAAPEVGTRVHRLTEARDAVRALGRRVDLAVTG